MSKRGELGLMLAHYAMAMDINNSRYEAEFAESARIRRDTRLRQMDKGQKKRKEVDSFGNPIVRNARGKRKSKRGKR